MLDDVLVGFDCRGDATTLPEPPGGRDPAFVISGAALVNERLCEVEALLCWLIPKDAAPAERDEAIDALAACVRAVARLEDRLAGPGSFPTPPGGAG